MLSDFGLCRAVKLTDTQMTRALQSSSNVADKDHYHRYPATSKLSARW